jgi:hypothetical protein
MQQNINMVYRFIITILFISFTSFLNAQTGIGTTTPNASAKLDVSATNKGFLPPRISLTDIYDQTTIPSPATGLLVYCKGDAGLAAGYYYWNGNAWATIATAGGSGSFAASFMRGSRTSSQTITVGGIVGFSSVDNSSGNDISLNTTDGKITLKAGNTYRLIASVPNFSGSRPSFTWYNETTGANIGSAVNGYSPSEAAANGSMGGIAQVIITPNVNTVVYLKLVSVSNSTTTGSIGTFGNGDFLSANGFPWFEAQVISGNAPITGQSVDYIQASLSANQTLSSAGNINFNVSNGAGITITNGGFNLIANKTYKLEGAIGGTSGGFAYYAWVDNTNTILPGGSIGATMKAGSAFSDAPQDKAIVYFTPTVDTRVFLRVYSVSGGVTAYAPSTASNYSSTWANIAQIGSSAIVNPWVLSGNDVYNTSGEVGIGNTAPNAKLDVRTNTTSTTDPGDGTIGLGTSSTTAAASGKGALRFNNSTNKVEVSTGSAWQGASSPIFAQFLANASQSSISTGTKINFQTTVINVGGITIASNNTITLPAGRIYRIDFNAGWVSMAGGWARFAIYNSGTIASIPAHLEAVNGSSAINSSGATTTFINTSSGSTTIDVRYLAPSGSTVSLGDSGNGTSYPYIVIQAVD